MFCQLSSIPYFVGIFVLFKVIVSFAKLIWRNFFRTGHDLLERYGQGSWACITGASDGGGKALAIELAKRGFNIILVARNQSKLNNVKKEILAIANVKVETVVFDMAASLGQKPNSLQKIKDVCDEINKFDVSLLAHYAGITDVGPYFDIPPALIRDLVEIKCVSYPLMTRFIGEKMATRSKRGGIIHCASVAGAIESIPCYNIGGCTQKFNKFLVKSIAFENKHKLDILVLKLGHMSSQMTGYDDPNALGTVLPEEAAQGVLRDLGYEDETFGHWKHDFLWTWISFVMNHIVPEFVQQKFMSNKLMWHKKDIVNRAKEQGFTFNAAYYK